MISFEVSLRVVLTRSQSSVFLPHRTYFRYSLCLRFIAVVRAGVTQGGSLSLHLISLLGIFADKMESRLSVKVFAISSDPSPLNFDAQGISLSKPVMAHVFAFLYSQTVLL